MDKDKQAKDALIKAYKLAPHPEGGYYREVFRSHLLVESPVIKESRSAATHIYFLLGRGDISRFHRVIHDEIWNFYKGAPLILYQYDGTSLTHTRIGPECNAYTTVVPGGTWQAAESAGRYSLVGCTVAPGFDFSDLTFLADAPDDRDAFIQAHDDFKHFL